MKTTLTGLVAAALGMMLSTPAMAANVARREVRQQERIAQGLATGQLTARETARLERSEAALHAQVQKDRADGGRFTAVERAKARVRQDRMSARIYVQKHDAQRR